MLQIMHAAAELVGLPLFLLLGTLLCFGRFRSFQRAWWRSIQRNQVFQIDTTFGFGIFIFVNENFEFSVAGDGRGSGCRCGGGQGRREGFRDGRNVAVLASGCVVSTTPSSAIVKILMIRRWNVFHG